MIAACLVAFLVVGARSEHRDDAPGFRDRAPATSQDVQVTDDPPSAPRDAPSVREGAPEASAAFCASTEEALGLLAQDGCASVAWQQAEGVEQAAYSLLVTYRDGVTPCVLAQSGYLDLLGNTWGCVIEGDGWVDVCVVREREGASTLRILRFDRGAVEDELG